MRPITWILSAFGFAVAASYVAAAAPAPPAAAPPVEARKADPRAEEFFEDVFSEIEREMSEEAAERADQKDNDGVEEDDDEEEEEEDDDDDKGTNEEASNAASVVVLSGCPFPVLEGEHKLDLASAYGDREPESTNIRHNFSNCLDYIFYSRRALRVRCADGGRHEPEAW